MPSSQTGKDETTDHPGPKGKGRQQNDTRRGNSRTLETIQIVRLREGESLGT